MTISKSSLLNVFILFALIFSSSSVLAVDAVPQPPKSSQVPVATVNIDDARIISEKNNEFTIAFTLSNKVGIQTGVKYGVQLVADGAKYIADEKVYDESITLNENSSVKKVITYTAPSQFSGNYTLYLASNNESSFPFGIALVGKVKLSATTKTVSINNDSCYLQVEGEKGNTHYTLVQGVDINASELLKLTCTAVNNTGNPLSVIPFFETRYFSSYGKLANQVGGEYKTIAFAKNEKKTFSISLPKGDAPQFYSMKVSLMNADTSSNTISLHYVISGVNGIIQKLSLDKDYYKIGERGEVRLIWSASNGNFLRSKSAATVPPKVSFLASIVNEGGRECAHIDQSISKNLQSPETKISFDTKATCLNPKVSATLTDDKGHVLDQKDFSFKSSGTHADENTAKSASSLYVAIIIVALLAIILLSIYMKKKKNSNSTIQ